PEPPPASPPPVTPPPPGGGGKLDADPAHVAEFKREVRDAKLVLEFAVENGTVGPDARPVDEAIMLTIKQTDDLLIAGTFPDAAGRTRFEAAYAKLVAFVAPVTANTLRYTSSHPQHYRRTYFLARDGASEATIWSRTLTVYTLIFVLVTLTGSVTS